MSNNLETITIFISGTQETEAERVEFLKKVDQLNIVLEGFKQLRIRVIKWPDDITPGVNDYPQKEINRQTVDKYHM
jgi:hypothetical protein